MNPKDFTLKFKADAALCEQRTGIVALATLSQAALESSWGDIAPGNMFFGIKDTDGINGNEQLITTTEFHSRMDVKYPQVISIAPVMVNGKKMFKYRVKDYFRKYDTPADSFINHSEFFLKNQRYSEALKVKHDAFQFFAAIQKAGYATDPNYADKLSSIAKRIQPYL